MRIFFKIILLMINFLLLNNTYANDIDIIYKVDARSLSFSDKNMLASMSGIINRKSTGKGVFLILTDYDLEWAQRLEEDGYNVVSTTKDELLNEFKSYFNGQVIFDGSDEYSRNIAATIAGINDAFITEDKVSGYSVIYDCRNKWSSKIEAYQWAVDNLLSSVNKGLVADLSYSVANLLDFIIANKVFVFDLDPLNNSDEINMINQIIGNYVYTTPVIGWPDGRYAISPQDNVDVENAFMQLINNKGLCLIASDFSANLSLFKKFLPEVKLLQYRKYEEYNASRKYFTFIMSDGDNLQYVLNYMYKNLWNDSAREEIPLGWSLSPVLYYWCGFALDTLFSDAHKSMNDEFIAPPSGFTYIQPNAFSSSALSDFLEKTKYMTLKLDEWQSMIIDSTTDAAARENMYKNYASLTYLNTLFLEAEVGIRNVIKNNNYGVLTLSQDIRGMSVSQIITDIRNQIASGKNMIYVYTHSWDLTPSNIKEVITGLADLSPVVVTPSTFSDLWMQKIKKSIVDIGSLASVVWQWNKGGNETTFKIQMNKSDLPVSFDNILSAKVIYWLEGMTNKYFQFMREDNNILKSEMLISDEYKNEKIYFYLEFITSNSNFYKSNVYPSYTVNSYSGPKIAWIEPTDGKGEIYLNQWFDFGGAMGYHESDINNTKDDISLLFYNSGSETNERGFYTGGRSADDGNYFIYKLIGDVTNFYKVDLRIGNNYNVEVSSDINGLYTTVLDSKKIFQDDIHDLSNLLYQSLDISSYMKNGNGVAYLKISDESTTDGWGGKCGALSMRIIPAYNYRDTIKFNVYTDKNYHTVSADFTALGGSIIGSCNNGEYTNIFPFSYRLDLAEKCTNGIYKIPIRIYNSKYSPNNYEVYYIIRLKNNEDISLTDEKNFIYTSGKGFSPDNDGINDKIKFYAPYSAGKMIIKIYNINGVLLNTIESAYVEDNKLYAEWDGKDNNNKIVPIGIYIYRLRYGLKYVNGTFVVSYK